LIHFVVVVGRHETVDRVRPRLRTAVEQTRLLDGAVIEHRATNGTWAAAYLDHGDEICDVRVAVQGDALAVVNGPALATAGNQQRLADEALGWFREGGSSLVAGRLGGSYNFVGIDPARGTRAFVDFSGMTPLYWAQTDDLAIFSNRSTTAQMIEGSSGWDVEVLSWMVGHSNLFGDRMPAGSVQYLPPGTEAAVAPGGTAVSLQRSETWVWPTESGGAGRDNLTSDEWDTITDDLIANFRAIGAVQDQVLLHLSGGKDSRLCLALAKAAGLSDRLSTVTNGPPTSPEIACAAKVAEAAGIPNVHLTDGTEMVAGRERPHHRTDVDDVGRAMAAEPTAPVAVVTDAPSAALAADPAPAAGPGDRDFNAVWHRIRQATYRYESIVDPWDGANPPIRNASLSIKGFGGELYRGPGGHAKRFKTRRPRSADEMAEMFVDYHQTMDPLGVLLHEVAAFQRDWLRSWVFETAAGVRLDVLPEKFYVDYRLGHWNGPLAQNKPIHIGVNPLLSVTAVRKIFELSIDARTAERLHYEVMRRTAPEVLEVSFVGDTWSPTILDESPLDLPREQFAPARPQQVQQPAPAKKGAPTGGVMAPPNPSRPSPVRRQVHQLKKKLPKPAFLRSTARSAGPNRVTTRAKSTKPLPNNRANKTWQWPFLEGQTREIVDLFDRAKGEMSTICDMDGLRAAAEGAADIRINVQGKALVAAICVATTLTGESEPVRDGH
jgi:hypothetical protein